LVFDRFGRGVLVLEVVATGPLTTVQDLGRPGLAALGVGRSGAADPRAFALANRLLGNPPDAAMLEATFGGLAVRALSGGWFVVTGAPVAVTVDGPGTRVRRHGMNAPLYVPAGALIGIGRPGAGLRTYVAVRGGVDVEPVLGSRATDQLSGIGPAVPHVGDVLPIGPERGPWPGVDVAPVPVPTSPCVLRVRPGPRADWFTPAAAHALTAAPYTVTPDSNRIGIRLDGTALTRARPGELPSEGLVPGAVQVPPGGQPTVFLADHPTTGGYPVLAVVLDADVCLAAQAAPGDTIRFRAVP